MPRGKITERKQSAAYQAIIRNLYEYWLSEPDELKVEVAMRFTHKDGRTQEKLITWKNPDQYAGKPPRLQQISAAELMKKEFPPDVFPYKYFNKNQ